MLDRDPESMNPDPKHWFFQFFLGRMRSLFCQVLESKDLSKAGDLFSVEDFAIVEEFPEITARIQVIRIGRSQ